jgi:uncharacterized heparinase superfamily protein
MMLGDISAISRILGAEAAARPIDEWVQAHGKLIDSTLWRSRGREEGRLKLYDLRPDVPLVPAP